MSAKYIVLLTKIYIFWTLFVKIVTMFKLLVILFMIFLQVFTLNTFYFGKVKRSKQRHGGSLYFLKFIYPHYWRYFNVNFRSLAGQPFETYFES